MGNIVNKDSWLGQEQLRFVEQTAWWNGMVSRADLVGKFGCSGQQASAILQGYLEMNPKALRYSPNVRRYLASPDMECIFEEATLESKNMFIEVSGLSALPVKKASPQVERFLMVALRQKRSVTVQYKAEGRSLKYEIIPTAFVATSLGYSVRAWSMKSEEYSDFYLTNISKIDWPEKMASTNLPVDEDWENMEELRFFMNARLSDEVKERLVNAYGLKSSSHPVVVSCRTAVKPHVIIEMGVDNNAGDAFFEIEHESHFEVEELGSELL